MLTVSLAAVAQPHLEGAHKKAMDAFASGNIAEAERLEQLALSQNPQDASVHLGLAVIYAQTGKTKEAIEEARKAVKISPMSFPGQFNLAELLLVDNQQEDALTHFNAALKIKPDSVSALIGKSKTLCRLGNPLAALQILESSRLAKNNQIQLQLAKTYFALGDFDETETAAQQILGKDPYSYEAKLLLAQIAFQKRNLPAAIISADELIKQDPSKSGAYILLSECFVITHSGLLNAVDIVRSAKESAQNKALVFSQLGQNFERCAAATTKAELDFDERKYAWRALAEECWRQAVKARPNNVDFRYHFAMVLRKNRKFVEAYYQTEKLLQLDPGNEAGLLLKSKLRQSKYDLFGWLNFYVSGGAQ